MKKRILLVIMLLFSSMLFSVVTVTAFDKEVYDFDTVYYHPTLGFNKNGQGSLIMAVTYTNNTLRNIDYGHFEFTASPFYLGITLADELEIVRDSEGNIIYQEPSEGYLYLNKQVVDNHFPSSIKKLASKEFNFKTIAYDGKQWYRLNVPNFNRLYEWKEYSTPIINQKWFTWGSSESILFKIRAMFIKQTKESIGSLEFDFTHPTDNSGQVVAVSKSYLSSKGIDDPYFEWGEAKPWKSISYSENETHYFIYPEHFSVIGVHQATTGTTYGFIKCDNPASNVYTDYTVEDAHVREDNPTTNYGTYTEIWVGEFASANSVFSYLRCNNSFSDNASLINDNMIKTELYVNYFSHAGSEATKDVDAYRVTSGWQDTVITWNTKPTDTGVSLDDWRPSGYGYHAWNVSSSIPYFASDSTQYFGWALKQDTLYTDWYARFRSNETGTSDPPYVRVTYDAKEIFIVNRSSGSTAERNLFNYTADSNYNDTDRVLLKISVSSNTKGISEVWNRSSVATSTEVDSLSEVVEGTYYYDSANYYVYIGHGNISSGDYVNWSVNCTYGGTFAIEPPTYLRVGDYFQCVGLISDASDVPISGLIATTKIMYESGEDAVEPVGYNCTDGNYFTTIATTALVPGIYDWSISFYDIGSGITFKKGGKLSLSVGTYGYYDAIVYWSFYDASIGTDSHSPTFTFYDPNTGMGLDTTWLQLYVSDDTTFTEDERVYAPDFETYTGQVLYYRVLDFFGNKIYPAENNYSTTTIEYTNQFVDIPIQMWALSVKNMNHSIVKFELHNSSRAYVQYLFPYEPFYWYVFPGDYNITMIYYNAVTGVVETWVNDTISIDNHTYYWIEGYDLRDIIIEIQVTNTTVGNLVLSITADISLVNSTVTNITTDILSNLTLTETNITTLINSYSSNFTIIESVVGFLNNTIWTNFTTMDATINTINNKLTIDFDMLNVTVDYLNNTIWTEFSAVNSTIIGVNTSITNKILLSETNVTTLVSNVWTALNLTDSMVSYLNTTIWSNISFINSTLNTMNNTLTLDIGLVNATVDYINTTIWNEITAVNTSVGEVNTVIINMWNTQNVSFGSLINRSTVTFNFYNTNEGLGLDRETLKVYINGSRLIETTYYCYNESDKINVTIKDYYNNTLYHNNFTITAPFTFIDLGLTFHSWLFGNKNDDYYMISLRKENATRWWERGVVPYGEREFMIPSGNYSMRIYDGDWVELYNSSNHGGNITVNNSRVYVIHGTNLSEIISGQSVIRGQLLELRGEVDYALTPEAVIWQTNPIVIFSVFDRIGMELGTDVWTVCPALNVIATTRNDTFGNWINSTALVPTNGTTNNGTITIVDDVFYMSGNSSVDWVNITYTSNGTLYQNTTYVPGRLSVNGENFTINASSDIWILRETTYSQMKKFYWNIYNSTTNPGYIDGRAGYHSAGITVNNSLDVPIYDVYVYAGFSDVTTPDVSTARVMDEENGILLERGENFKTTDGIEFKIEGGVPANYERGFTLEYYKDTSHTYHYGDATYELRRYEKERTIGTDGEFYNYGDVFWVNDKSLAFRGSLIIKFGFDIDLDVDSVKVYDKDKGKLVDDSWVIVSAESVRIASEALGDVHAGGGRSFGIYFQELEYPGQSVDEYHLTTPFFHLGGLPISFFTVGLILCSIVAIAGAILIVQHGFADRYILLLLCGLVIALVLWILQAKGV